MKNIIKVDYKSVKGFLTEDEISFSKERALGTYETLINGTGRGNDFLGWLELPTQISDELVDKIESVATRWRNSVEVIVVVGIGGSYLGAKAAIDALSHSFSLLLGKNSTPSIVFAGQNLSEDYMSELMELLKERSSACVVPATTSSTHGEAYTSS